MKSKKGSVSIYISFMFIAILVILIAAVFAPLGVQLNSEFYRVGEEMLLDANVTISQIQDSNVRSQIQTTLNNALDASQNNIEVNAAMFQYSWLGVIALAGLVVFLFTRSLVEVQSRGGGIV